MMRSNIMNAKAGTTETAGAAAANPEDTTAGKAGTIEERLKLRGAPPAGDEAAAGDESAGDETAAGDESAGDETAAGDEAATGDESAGDEAAADEDEGKIKDGEVEGLDPKAQAKINKRIHALNIKRKNAEAKTEQTESQLTDLGKKIQDASIQAAMKLGFDPNYISADEAKTLNRVEQLRAWRKFLRAHRGEPYEGSGTKEDPSMSIAEMAEREAAVEDELLDIGGPARTMALERMALKDADAAVGRKIRLARQSPDGANKSSPPKKVDPKPPRLPGSDGATRRPPVSTASKGKPVFDKAEFNKAGGDKDALGKAYEKIYGG